MLNAGGNPIQAGAQAITWGETIKENLPGILGHLHTCGYRGAEIGIRHFDLARPEYYRDLFAAHEMEPVATHTGGTFWDKAQAEAELENIERAIGFAQAIGCSFFAISGNPQETAETMKASAEAYNRIGQMCKDGGLELAYHNHDWEFAQGGAVYETLLTCSDPDLVRLVPDVAWVYRAGLDPAQVVRENANRLAYLHLKDTIPDMFCELGEGQVNLEDVISLLPRLQVEWVVVEQDTTETTPEQSLETAAQYLRDAGIL